MKTGERTVMQTAEFIAEATGLDTSHLRTISRRLREAGLLSQAGHGRGAAAATPQDAALLLLTSALGVPSLHAVLIGEAILNCTVGTINDDKTDDCEFAASAVDHVASMIVAGEDVEVMFVGLQGHDLGVIIGRSGASFHYEMPERSPHRRRLEAMFGLPGRVVRSFRGEIRGGVLPEISEFLWVEGAEGAEVA